MLAAAPRLRKYPFQICPSPVCWSYGSAFRVEPGRLFAPMRIGIVVDDLLLVCLYLAQHARKLCGCFPPAGCFLSTTRRSSSRASVFHSLASRLILTAFRPILLASRPIPTACGLIWTVRRAIWLTSVATSFVDTTVRIVVWTRTPEVPAACHIQWLTGRDRRPRSPR